MTHRYPLLIAAFVAIVAIVGLATLDAFPSGAFSVAAPQTPKYTVSQEMHNRMTFYRNTSLTYILPQCLKVTKLPRPMPPVAGLDEKTRAQTLCCSTSCKQYCAKQPLTARPLCESYCSTSCSYSVMKMPLPRLPLVNASIVTEPLLVVPYEGNTPISLTSLGIPPTPANSTTPAPLGITNQSSNVTGYYLSPNVDYVVTCLPPVIQKTAGPNPTIRVLSTIARFTTQTGLPVGYAYVDRRVVVANATKVLGEETVKGMTNTTGHVVFGASQTYNFPAGSTINPVHVAAGQGGSNYCQYPIKG